MNVATLPTRAPDSPGPRTVRSLLRHVERADAQTLRSVYAQSPWTLRGTTLKLRWQDAGATPPGEGLACKAAHGSLWLALDDWAALDATLALAAPRLPAAVRLGLLEQAAQPVLDVLPRLVGGPVRCNALTPPPPPSPNPDAGLTVGFHLIDVSGATMARGWLVCDGCALVRLPTPPFDRERLARLDPVPVALPVQIGRCTLPWRELSSLGLGDLLRMDVPPRARGSLRLLAPWPGAAAGLVSAAGLICSVRDSTLTVEACVGTAFETPEAGLAPAVADLGQIPCTVVMELGRITLTMGELARMRPGHTLELSAPPGSASVRLVVHGRTIGHGELVTVGDELAVAVQSLDLPNDG
jgi:type III secretion system YscQ/HrcQ family protein